MGFASDGMQSPPCLVLSHHGKHIMPRPPTSPIFPALEIQLWTLHCSDVKPTCPRLKPRGLRMETQLKKPVFDIIGIGTG